jgi:endonuclease G
MMQSKGESSGQAYFADNRIDKGEAAELSDWNGSGMDKGRLGLLSSFGQPNANAQTYALTNVVAQPPRFHKQVWSKVETEVKNYVSVAKGDVYVYTGALFTSIDKMQILGNNRVWVPTHLYKLVYDPQTNNAWAYVVANEADAQIGKPLNYESFMRTAKLRLLP